MSSWNCFVCKEYKDGNACTFCDDGSKFKRMTNGDHVRNMTDEELAEFLLQVNSTIKDCMIFGCDEEEESEKCICEKCFLQWLQAEVEEGE